MLKLVASPYRVPNNAVAATYRYDSFGVKVEADASTTCPIRFQEMYYDSETGLYWGGGGLADRTQYYSPDLGRWMGRNPAGESADANLYRMKLVQEIRWPAGAPKKLNVYDPGLNWAEPILAIEPFVRIAPYFVPGAGLILGTAVNWILSGYERGLNGEGGWDATKHGLGDATGFTMAARAMNNEDPYTSQQLNMGIGQRIFEGVLGVTQMAGLGAAALPGLARGGALLVAAGDRVTANSLAGLSNFFGGRPLAGALANGGVRTMAMGGEAAAIGAGAWGTGNQALGLLGGFGNAMWLMGGTDSRFAISQQEVQLRKMRAVAVHNEYLKQALAPEYIGAPGMKTPYGRRFLDGLDESRGIGFEANTTPWEEMTWAKYNEKITQIEKDIWFGLPHVWWAREND